MRIHSENLERVLIQYIYIMRQHPYQDFSVNSHSMSFQHHYKSFLLMRQHMFQDFWVNSVSTDKIRLEWGQNDGEKNLGHLPCFKNFFIPPSFKSLTIIPGWENYHSSNISFILRSFGIWMTIEWQNNHFTLTQNDRDGQGMRVIKIFSIIKFSPLNSLPCHSIILKSFLLMRQHMF